MDMDEEIDKIINSIKHKEVRSLKEIREINNQAIDDAFILIKGSRGMKLEQVVDYL